ncbi:MAG: SOS response-associated peptidase [Pirellula sp.]
MCGRFTLKTPVLDWLMSLLPEHSKHWERIVAEFQIKFPELCVPRYNIAPSQSIVVLTQSPHGECPQLASMRWGLIPSWSDSPNIAFKMINARSETLTEKPSFRGLLEAHRCVVIADGYYEWQRIPGTGSKREQKLPHWIHRPDRGPLAMAGLWTTNRKILPAQETRSATIITADANGELRPIHDRMPTFLREPGAVQHWLDLDVDGDGIPLLLGTSPEGSLAATPVGSDVNSPRNDGPQLLVEV